MVMRAENSAWIAPECFSRAGHTAASRDLAAQRIWKGLRGRFDNRAPSLLRAGQWAGDRVRGRDRSAGFHLVRHENSQSQTRMAGLAAARANAQAAPDLPKHMEGGMENPLGARAIFQKASAKILPHLHIEIVKRSDQAKGFELEWLSSGPHCQKDRKVSWAAPPRQSLVRPIQHRAHRRVGAYSQVAPICASHKPRHHRSCFGLASWALADILVER